MFPAAWRDVDINGKELFTILLGYTTFKESVFAGKNVEINTDSGATESCADRMFCKDDFMMDCFRALQLEAAEVDGAL